MNLGSEIKISLEDFREISDTISGCDDFNLLVTRMVQKICSICEVKGASIMLLDEEEDRLLRVSSCGISEQYLNKGPVFVDSCYCCMRSGKVELVHDLQSDERIQYPEAARKEGLYSLLAVPIKYRETPVGAIRLYHTAEIDITEQDIESLCVLGRQLGVVIENDGLKNFLDHVRRAVDNLPPRMRKQ